MAGGNIKEVSALQYPFLSGGGKMGNLIRSKDWSLTGAGTPDTWPQSLRTTLSILLNSRFPMFLWWGPELTCFYNDAYRPSLGENGKHPAILGMPAKEAWPEIWHIIKPLIDQVLSGGEPTWSEDQLIPIYRNGKLENVYWTFSYSPVNDESGKPAGVFVTCKETTEKVITQKILQERSDQLQFAIDATDLATWDLDTATNKFTGNERLKEWHGLHSSSEFDLEKGINAIIEKDRETVKNAINKSLEFSSRGILDIEYTIVHPVTQQSRIVRAKGRATFGEDNIAYRLNGTLQDITEQVNANKKIEESKYRFEAAIQAIEGILWTNNAEGQMEGVQVSWAGLTGQSYAEYQGYGWAKAVHPDDAQPTVDAWNLAVKERKIFIFEHRVRLKDGSWGNFSIRAIPVLNDDGSIREWVGVHTNITEQKNAVAAIQESEERFRTMAEGTDILIAVADETRNATYFNEAWSHLTGRLVNELLQFGWANLIHPEDRDNYVNIYLNAFEKKKPFTGELRVLNKEGNYSWLLAKGIPRFRPDGSFAGYISSCVDITDRKNAEEEIKRFKYMADNATETFILMRENGSFEYLNKAALEKWGYTYEEAKCLRVPDVDLIYNDEIFNAAFSKAQKESIPLFETIHKKKDGTAYPVEVNMGGLTIGGKPYLFAVARDITERKITEELLKESEKEFRQLADSLPELVWTTDSNGAQVFASKRWKEFTGLDPYDITTFEKMVHPDDLQNTLQVWADCLATGNIYKTQVRLKSKNGDYQWFYVHGEPIINEGREIEKWIGAFTNFNDQKKAEEELTNAFLKIEESEKRFSNVANTAPVFIWMAGIDMVRNFFNTAWLNFTGRSLEQEKGNGWTEGVHPDDLEKCINTYTSSFKKQEEYFMEYRLRRFDGEYRWISARGVPRFTSNGIFEGYIGACMDIHDRVIFHKKLKEDEERLNIVIKASDLGTWELNLKTMELIYSDTYIEMFGYDKTAHLSHAELLNHLHPDDLLKRNAAFEIAAADGVLQYESRVIWKDKSVHWVENKGKVFYDEENNPHRIIGTTRDTTDEKNYEQQLLDREQKFRLLADSMPQFVWTGDAEGNLNYFSQAVYDYSGLTAEQLGKEGWLQIVHPEDREANAKAWIHAITTGTDFIFEHRFGRYDGVYRWQLSRAIPQRDADGKIQMWVGTSTDIQEMKEQDQQKDFFISMASHELKTPITSIKGYVQILQSTYKKSEDGFLKNSLRIIDKQILTLTNLISDLLDVSKIKSGSLVLNKEHFEITDLVKEVVNEIIHINPDYSISFSGAEEVTVYADKGRIGQVLINFLTNAVKYSPNSKKIIVASFIRNGQVLVSVEDSGIGISKADQEKIFERFYRVEGKNEKTYPGFGIGLFIASEIIKRHDGKIGVTSEPDKGSVFFFSIPLLRV